MPRIFVSQKRVHQWTEEGRVSIEGNLMTLPDLGRVFRLTEAFFVERAVSEVGDTLKLAGRVKTRGQIASLGGEVFLNSLVVGDAAYEGDPGFVGEAITREKARTNRDGPSRSGAGYQPVSTGRDGASRSGAGYQPVSTGPGASRGPSAGAAAQPAGSQNSAVPSAILDEKTGPKAPRPGKS